MIGITWKRIEDRLGHAPIEENLKIICPNCKIDMLQRNSIIWPGNTPPINEVGWKCPRCAYYKKFIIEDTREYIEEVLKRRDGHNWMMPPLKTWTDDDEAALQLEALGYFGGRGKDKEK